MFNLNSIIEIAFVFLVKNRDLVFHDSPVSTGRRLKDTSLLPPVAGTDGPQSPAALQDVVSASRQATRGISF